MSELAGLRVALVAGTLGQGGAERQLFHVATTLLGAGAHPRVLSLSRGEHWEAPLLAAGVPVEWVGARASKAMRLLAITRAAARHQADLIQSFHFYANPYAALAGRALGRPDLGAVRSSGDSDIQSVGPRLAPLCVRLPRLLVTNSDAARQNLQRRGVRSDHLRLLPNAIDLDSFTPARRHDDSGPFAVAVICRLWPDKRLDRALRVIAAVRHRLTRELRVVVAGAGPERAALEAQAAALGLGSTVTFAGSLPDVRPLLHESDCLLLASDHEGTPNVILEAMASARPVVATSVGGVADLVASGETGLLAARDDEAGLADALVRIEGDPSFAAQLGRAGRARVDERFSLRLLEGHLRALYGEIVPGGASRPGARSRA